MYKAFRDNYNGKHFICVDGNFYRGDWIEGCLLTIPYDDEGRIEYYIVEEVDWRDTIYDIHRYASKVIPETICEAVPGLKDSEGRQIYTHDVVECQVIRCGSTYYNWCRTTNINHGKCRTLPLEIYYTEKLFGSYGGGFAFRLTDKAMQLIEEYEKPIGNEKTRQKILWENPNKEDLIKVIGTIFDKENN